MSDIGKIALELAQIFFARRESKAAKNAPENKVRLKIYAIRVVLAIRFMLLARFYYFRANINAGPPIDEHSTQAAFQHPQEVLRDFRRAIKDYNQQVRSWGLNKKLEGWKEAGDSIAFRSWSRDFGQIDSQEPAWERFARSIGTELRFQSRNARLKQHLQEIRHPPLLFIPMRLLKICVLWAFKYSTGFGLKPERFIGTTIGTILIFSGLYFFDDAASGCTGISWESYGHEIYYAIANLTSIGASPGPCGGAREVLISWETLVGYFLLSMLAALFFAWISDS